MESSRSNRLLLGLIALSAPVFVTYLVLHGSHLMMMDYWACMLRLFRPDGSIEWRGVLVPTNEHYALTAAVLFIIGWHFGADILAHHYATSHHH